MSAMIFRAEKLLRLFSARDELMNINTKYFVFICGANFTHE